ncbi:MAG: ABC-2 family transporter protein [Elusimicrobiota bacterium]
MRLFRIWLRMAAMSLQAQLSHKLGSLGFLVGKLIRLLFFFAYLLAVFRHTDTIAGYSLLEISLFFLTFNLVDITAQVFLRGVYAARHLVTEGDLDTYLIQPCPPLLRMIGLSVDFLDIVTLLPVLVLLGLTWERLPENITALHCLAYLLLVLNGIAIAFAIHIFVASLAVRTQELENTIWVYRDMMFLGKLPVDIYAGPLRWVLTFLIPIAVMTSFPTKALLGTLEFRWMIFAVGLAAVLLGLSSLAWRSALKHYTSISS